MVGMVATWLAGDDDPASRPLRNPQRTTRQKMSGGYS